MSDAASTYVLPAPDAELDALIGADLSALEDDDRVAVGDVLNARVDDIDGENLRLRAGDQTLLCPIPDARDLAGNLPATNAEVDALIEEIRHDGTFRVSIDKPRQLKAFAQLETLANAGEPVEGRIILARRNGVSVDCNGARGFARYEDLGVRRDEGEALVGQTLTFHVRDLDPDNAQLRLTREAFVKQEREQSFAAAAAKLHVGQRVHVTITRTTTFGAFARIPDIDDVEGLIHISELDVERVDAAKLPVQTGDVVEVEVLVLDDVRQRIALSRREPLLEDLRARIQALETNSVLTGTVSGLTDFGAFIELDGGLRGLCHVSEISWTERDKKPSDLLQNGQTVQARVLQTDPANQRISLSIRQASDNPWSRFIEAHPIGSAVDGHIREIKDRGLVIALEDGLEGFVRLADLSWTIRAESPNDVREFTEGEAITLALLQVDTQRQRIALGLKQLEGDPWDLAGDRTTVGTIFQAEVTRLADNAAFLAVVPGLDARLHISEISTERVESLRSAVRVGQELEVMTTRADRERRRLDVSIKAIEEKRLAEQPREYSEDSDFGELAAALRESGVVKN